jgi:hypothetical protein
VRNKQYQHYEKESKSRRPVTEDHEIIRGVIRVLEEQGGPMTSVAVFRRGFELGLFGESQYNTVRARLSQHCDLAGATVVRAPGSKVGVRGSRTTAWALSDQGGVCVKRLFDGTLVASPVNKRRRADERAVVRNVVLSDSVLAGAPASVRLVAGRTARQALLSAIDKPAVRWLLDHLPLEGRFRARLQSAFGAAARGAVIAAEEQRRGTA